MADLIVAVGRICLQNEALASVLSLTLLPETQSIIVSLQIAPLNG